MKSSASSGYNTGVMRLPRLSILILTIAPAAVFLIGCGSGTATVEPLRKGQRANSYPVILVHGLLGFGRDELFGYRYWGGFTDLERQLNQAGYETYTAAVGPVSSMWDRACELYACIKGGRVDYGREHVQRYGHHRYGRRYPGLYPQWGEVDRRSGRVNKVHIIGHSLGGITGRTLIQLLEQGSSGQGEHPLFQGGNSWVCSLTTISSPHDGTTLVYRYDWDRSLLKPAFSFLISITSSSPELYYDFKLDQWGLSRREDEIFSEYLDRVMESDLWSRSADTAYRDGSPEGALELNRWVRAQPGVYYFSWATEATFRDPLDGTELPEIGMSGSLAPISRFMGCFSREAADAATIDSSWWQNDGVVNTNSMDGPTLGSGDTILPYDGKPVPGCWQYMGLHQSVDHLDVIGIPIASSSLRSWYLSLAALLASLP